MNLFYTNLDTRFTKFNVYNVLTMTDDFMVVSGMPNNIGKIIFCMIYISILLLEVIITFLR